jgi:hypothetical protein
MSIKYYILLSILFIFLVCILFTKITENQDIIEKWRKTNKENIFLYWEQGWENAPLICKKCFDSWIKFNKNDYNVIQLDKTNIKEYIPRDTLILINKIKDLKSITSSSDLLRINLIALHGGFWVDATIMCTSPIRHYKHKLENQYNFWCPFDIDNRIHSYNYLYCTKNNEIVKKVALNMNRHFNVMSDEEMKHITYLYLGRLMYDEFDKYIDWKVIKDNQLSQSSNNKKLGYKIVANSKSLLMQPITKELKSKINSEYFLKLTVKHGIKDYTVFDKGSVIEYLIRTYL